MSHPTAPALRRQSRPPAETKVDGEGWRVEGPKASPPSPSEPLAEFGRVLREEFGNAFDRFSTLQRDACDELLLFGLAHPDQREEMLAVLEHELTRAAGSVRLARRFGAEKGGAA